MDILRNAEIQDPHNIIDDEDDEYQYDLQKKQQRPKSGRYLAHISRAVIWLGVLVLVYNVYNFFVYTTYDYYDQDEEYLTAGLSITHQGIKKYSEEAKEVDWNKYAYVSYATSLNYLCGTLMMFKKLKVDYGTKARLILFHSISDVFSRDDYSSFLKEYAAISARYNVTLVPIRNRAEHNVQDLNFKDSFNKLELFQFAKYSVLRDIDRYIYLDSDVYLNDKLDELFFLPNKVDLAMPAAYWLTSPDNNKRRLLSKYPSAQEHLQAGERDVVALRTEEGMEWSTALMVVKPSEKLNLLVNRHLSRRMRDDYDMDVINLLIKSKDKWGANDLKTLTIPHQGYFMITGDFFLTPENRYYYLTEPRDLPFINRYALKKCKSARKPYWCDVKTGYVDKVRQAKVIHFSDFPLPKPWYQIKETISCRDKNSDVFVKDCSDFNVWAHYHNQFILDRIEVCGLHQEVE